MKTMILLAMHGAPPLDFPRSELSEYMSLYAQHESGSLSLDANERFEKLEVKLRTWPRTPQNDPFNAASIEMAAQLQKASGLEVLVGYNEFCAPDILLAIGQAVAQGAGKVIVTTPMLTRGGNHAEKDIPEILEKARIIFPEVFIIYAWPSHPRTVAEFLNRQISPFL